MDLFTLSAINMVIGLFTCIYFAVEYSRAKAFQYLLDFSLFGACLLVHSVLSISHLHFELPYMAGAAFINTMVIIMHLCVLRGICHVLRQPVHTPSIVVFVILTYCSAFLPLFQYDQTNRLILFFALIAAVNYLCLRLLYQAKNEQYAGVIAFFKYAMLFNIVQTLLRAGLFLTGKYGFTHTEPNLLVYQFGWFSLTIYTALILTGGLIVLARQRQIELEHRVERDALTGLLNRYSMHERLSTELSRCLRAKSPLTLIMFDIDHFKRVNDTYGHQVGDDVIREVAAIAHAMLRNYDLAFRLGGEEFLLCLPGVSQHQAEQKVEMLRRHIQSVQIVPAVTITISIGFVVATHEQQINTLIKQADDALYHAKNSGRNRASGWLAGQCVSILQNLVEIKRDAEVKL